jgi:hypothetical protein
MPDQTLNKSPTNISFQREHLCGQNVMVAKKPSPAKA